MALAPYSTATNIIGTLGTDPEDRTDLDDQGLKDKFDQNSVNIVAYINGILKNAVDAKSEKLVEFLPVTASKTFALTDADKIQMCNHASVAINLTIPPNSSVAFPVGTVLAANMVGAAQVAFVAGSGVTITPATKLKINAQNDTVAAVQTESNKWLLIGSVKA